jgi:hypothetical protein
VKFPLGPLSFFADTQTYPDAPYFVYPLDPVKILKSTDMWAYQEKVQRAARYEELKYFTSAANPYPTLNMVIPDVAAWESAGDVDPTYTPVIVKMVTGSMADFEKNYAAFVQMLNNWGNMDGTGTQKAMAADIKFFAQYYKEQVLPKMMKK